MVWQKKCIHIACYLVMLLKKNSHFVLFLFYVGCAGCSLSKAPFYQSKPLPDASSLSRTLPDPSSLSKTISDLPSLLRIPPDMKPIALMPFFSAISTSKYVGQEAADRVALELMAKGYIVIDRSTTTTLINEAKFYSTGLNDDMRNALQTHNISAVIFGSINDFGCETTRVLSKSASLVSDMDKKNRCTASLTAKIIDIANGRLLWGVTLSDTSEGENLTAMELMKSLISKSEFSKTLPDPRGDDVSTLRLKQAEKANEAVPGRGIQP